MIENIRGSSPIVIAVLVTMLFVSLKIFGVITWSWWWVFSPVLFIVGTVVLVVLTIVMIFFMDNGRSNDE